MFMVHVTVYNVTHMSIKYVSFTNYIYLKYLIFYSKNVFILKIKEFNKIKIPIIF